MDASKPFGRKLWLFALALAVDADPPYCGWLNPPNPPLNCRLTLKYFRKEFIDLYSIGNLLNQLLKRWWPQYDRFYSTRTSTTMFSFCVLTCWKGLGKRIAEQGFQRRDVFWLQLMFAVSCGRSSLIQQWSLPRIELHLVLQWLRYRFQCDSTFYRFSGNVIQTIRGHRNQSKWNRAWKVSLRSFFHSQDRYVHIRYYFIVSERQKIIVFWKF